MKSFREIQNEAEKSDYTRVAELVGKSPSLVKMVVNGERTDHHNIQKVFSDLLTHRQRIAEREERRRKRMERNRIAA
jgi:hypothetical protein